MIHPGREELIGFLMYPSRSGAVGRHLEKGCAGCARLLAEYGEILSAAEVEFHHPPDWATRKAFSLGYHLEGKKRPLRRLECVFDSLTAPVPIGLRETGRPSRLLLFEGGCHYVHIKLATGEEADHCNIHGQALLRGLEAAPLADAVVTVERGRSLLSEGRTDDLGEFSFHDLRPGRFRVKIHSGEGTFSMVIPKGET